MSRIICPTCQANVARSSFKEHVRRLHTERGPRVTCVRDGCKTVCIDQAGLEKHVKDSHTGVADIVCDTCGERFKKQTQLAYHNKMKHVGGKLKCPVPGCGESRASKKNIIAHLNASAAKGGHDGAYKWNDSQTPKRKLGDDSASSPETTDLAEAFLDNIKDKLKNSSATRPTCRSKYCAIIDLSCGFPGGDKIYCKKHKDEVDGVIKFSDKNCSYVGCKINSICLRVSKFKFCASHAKMLIEEGLPTAQQSVKVPKDFSKKCEASGCTLTATFDGKRFCMTHSITGQSDDTRVCEIHGCHGKRPTFGFPGTKPTRCKTHKEEGMFSHKLCEATACETSASYGEPGGRATHCKQHAPRNYILNLVTCAKDGCDRQPSFGRPGEKYTHCSEHKLECFVDTRNKHCMSEGCTKNRSFGAQGGERKWCLQHKTESCINLVEVKCCMECCTGDDGNQARYFHPEYDVKESAFYRGRICSFARRIILEDAIMSNDKTVVDRLLAHFGLDNVLTLNAQSAFRIACEKTYYTELQDCVDIVFDDQVQGRKFAGAKRPDIFYKWRINGNSFGIHIEYDEESGHEEDETRLQQIEESAGCGGRVYVLRVRGGHGTKNPVCTRVLVPDDKYEYFEVTDTGKKVAAEVAQAVMQRIEWIKKGLAPDDGAQRPYKLYM